MSRAVSPIVPPGGDRGHQHGRWGRIALKVLLHHQPAQRVSDDDRRLRELGRCAYQVVDVAAHPVPDSVRPLIVAAQLHGADVVPALGQAGSEVVPAPGTVPGAMDEQDSGHARDCPLRGQPPF